MRLTLFRRNYKDFIALEFLVVMTAAAFAWSVIFFFLDMVGMGKIHIFRVIDQESNVHGGGLALSATAVRSHGDRSSILACG